MDSIGGPDHEMEGQQAMIPQLGRRTMSIGHNPHGIPR